MSGYKQRGEHDDYQNSHFILLRARCQKNAKNRASERIPITCGPASFRSPFPNTDGEVEAPNVLLSQADDSVR